MTTAVQRRRGTATEHSSFTGLEGELSVNTTNESVHVHDGSTAGGFELMRADGSNSSVTLGDISGVTAGTGLSGGGTSGTVTLDIDSTVTTLDGTQTLTNKTLTSPTLNTPTIGTSFTIGGATITEAELEILDGATVTTTELNYVDGVTSSIQTQIDAKAPLASPTFTGTVTMDGLTVDTNTLYVDSTNNRVGIGTTSPSANLDIESTTGNQLRIAYNSSFYWDVEREAATGDLTFTDASNGETVRFTDDGKVGIGTTSPSRTLHLKEAVPSIRLEDTDVSGVYHEIISEANTGYCIRVDEGNVSSGSYFRVDIDNSEKMRIDSSGRVGIGTTSPTFKLDVAGNARANYFALRANESAPSESAFVYRPATGVLGFGTSSAERMRIDSSGNLLVGRTSTSGSLTDHGHQLYNSGLYYLYSSATGNSDAFRMYDGNGTLRATIDGDGDYTDLSDVRAKENIVNAPSVLSTINDLQVRSFTWKVDGRHQTYGFVAQELNEAIPEAVSLPEEEDGMWGVKHAKLVPVLVKAIQEQQTLIESLTDRIAALEE